MEHVNNLARSCAHENSAIIEQLLNQADSTTTLESALKVLQESPRVTLNFHPDRIVASDITIAESLLLNGWYQNQFETGVSNGGLVSYQRVDRHGWEARMFGNSYLAEGTANGELPKYGTLNLLQYLDGGAPRFGSCFLELKPAVAAQRCTFTFGDSVTEPGRIATMSDLRPVLRDLLHSVVLTRSALQIDNTTIDEFFSVVSSSESPRFTIGRTLDDYIEAQIHGAISLRDDVERLVVDLSFKGTPTDRTLGRIAERYDLQLEYHPGFFLHPEEVPRDFRGPEIAELGVRIAENERITAEVIGRAAQSVVRESDKWQNWDTEQETLQHLKKLWHVLVAFGHPIQKQ